MTDVIARYRTGNHQRGEDTRRRLIETAIEVFANEGYEGTTTRGLAERAGVNLPAIQYYFGSKEGLFRAVIEHIIREIDELIAPVAERIRLALAESDTGRRQLIALLGEMLDALVAATVGNNESERCQMFVLRSEIEHMPALDLLHGHIIRRIVEPCAALIGRLCGQPADSEQTILRTLSILGQVLIFRKKLACGKLRWTDIGSERVTAIQAVVREQTAAILRPYGARRPRARST